MNKDRVNELKSQSIQYLPQLIELDKNGRLEQQLRNLTSKLSEGQIEVILDSIREIPDIQMTVEIFENDQNGKRVNKRPLFGGGEEATLVVKLKNINKSKCMQAKIKKLKKKKNFSWFLIAANM